MNYLLCRTPSWQTFTQRLGKYGEGYTGPGYNRLRERLLKDARQRVDADLGPFWLDAEYTGVTLMSDGWTDPSHRPLINVLAATPKGSCFLFAKNCEGKVKDAEFTADVWSKGMEQVGPDMCHCLVIDGASVNTAAARIFEDRSAVSPCHACQSAHAQYLALLCERLTPCGGHTRSRLVPTLSLIQG